MVTISKGQPILLKPSCLQPFLFNFISFFFFFFPLKATIQKAVAKIIFFTHLPPSVSSSYPLWVTLQPPFSSALEGQAFCIHFECLPQPDPSAYLPLQSLRCQKVPKFPPFMNRSKQETRVPAALREAPREQWTKSKQPTKPNHKLNRSPPTLSVISGRVCSGPWAWNNFWREKHFKNKPLVKLA